MNPLRRVARVCLIAGLLWIMLVPSLALADDGRDDDEIGGSCTGTHSPHCVMPEVPVAAIYPAVGGLSFAALSLLRTRRRPEGD